MKYTTLASSTTHVLSLVLYFVSGFVRVDRFSVMESVVAGSRRMP